MRVVVTGSEGQLGSALKLTCPADIEPVWLGHKDLDITDEAAVARHPAFEGADAIINTAGYTNVDAAETDRDAAWVLNASAPGFLARRAAEVGAHLVHLSTDYVFGTVAYRRPLVPDTPAHPTSVYGESKRAGECGARLGGEQCDCAHGMGFFRCSLAHASRFCVHDDGFGETARHHFRGG